MPSVDQKRPRVSLQERPIAMPIVARSRMIAAGTRKSFVDSHSTIGRNARTSSTPSTTAAGGATAARPKMATPTIANATTIAAIRSSE